MTHAAPTPDARTTSSSPADAAPLRVAVVGAGAVGAVLGERLARAGAAVTFLARGATLAALREQGLVVEHPAGEVGVPPGHAAASAAEIGAVDVVLVAVKAGQVPEVAPTLAPLVGDGTAVVPLQNGVEASAQLAAVLGSAHVAEGFCRMLAEQVAPGRIRHAGDVPAIAFGARGANAPHAGTLADGARAALERLGDAFRRADVTVETPDDVEAALWEKSLFVEPLGVVGAAARATFGELLGDPETRATLAACGREIHAVARGCGVAMADDAPARAWARYEGLPAGGTASMQRDLVAGRPSELEAQTGAIVRLGRAHGVATPVHDVLYAVLRPQEARARSSLNR